MQPLQLAIGPFSFDPASLTLWRDGVRIALGNRAAEVLGALLAADGAVVTREALIEAAWKGAIVEENNLAVQVVALRRAVTDSGLPFEVAIAALTTVPAATIGRADDLGWLDVGYAADAVLLTDGLAVDAVWSAGSRVH